MRSDRLTEVGNELQQLMLDQIESLRAETFCGKSDGEVRRQDERLHRIRELSAEFLVLLKQDLP